MKTISLREWGRVGSLQLDDAALEALVGSDVVGVSPDPATRHTWSIAGKQFVGVAQFGDLELRIHPKVGVHQLTDLLIEAQQLIQWDPSAEPLLAEAPDVVSVIATAFVTRCSEVLRQGLLHGYRTFQDALPAVRGRIDTGAQLSRRTGLPLPVELTFDDFTPDIVENQLLAGATRQLLRHHEVPMSIRNSLRRIDAQLVDVSPTRPSHTPPHLQLTRLNERYRAATGLARIVLQATSLDERLGAVNGTGFLVDMNRLFEDVVGRGLDRATRTSGWRIDLQRQHPLDADHRMTIRPDIICRDRSGRVQAVIDVKYKRPDVHDLAPGDVYQVLAYAHRFGLDRVHLVYASPPPYPNLRVGDVEVRLSWIDLGLPRAERTAQLEELAWDLLGLAAPP